MKMIKKMSIIILLLYQSINQSSNLRWNLIHYTHELSYQCSLHKDLFHQLTNREKYSRGLEHFYPWEVALA